MRRCQKTHWINLDNLKKLVGEGSHNEVLSTSIYWVVLPPFLSSANQIVWTTSQCLMVKTKIHLGGGFNHLEKYESQWLVDYPNIYYGNDPNVPNHFKPPTRKFMLLKTWFGWLKTNDWEIFGILNFDESFPKHLAKTWVKQVLQRIPRFGSEWVIFHRMCLKNCSLDSWTRVKPNHSPGQRQLKLPVVISNVQANETNQTNSENGATPEEKKAYSWFKHQKLMRRLSIVVSEWSDYAPAIYQMEN